MNDRISHLRQQLRRGDDTAAHGDTVPERVVAGSIKVVDQ